MLKTLITITAIALIVAITIWIVRRCCARCDQSGSSPPAYTLLKSSPLILQREMWALKLIAVLCVVFLLLLLTSAYYNGSCHFLIAIQHHCVALLDIQIMDPVIMIAALIILAVEVYIRLL
jgi:hypothetical protein